ASRAVDQQVRQASGQYSRFLRLIIVVGFEIDSIFVDVAQEFISDGRHFGLGVTHGGWWVVILRAKVALSQYEWITHGPRLRHTYQGVIHGHVTVGVIAFQYFTHGARAFTELLSGLQAHLIHGV